MAYQIISFDQKDSWSDYINRSCSYDFYHTWHYFSLDNTGTPFLFVYEHLHHFIAFPLIRRPIQNTGMYDLTSSYGYTGPVSDLPFDALAPKMVKGFLDAFHSFCKKTGVVSVFCTLHPIFQNHVFFTHARALKCHGKTIAIDLYQPVDAQRAKYRKAYRQSIRQLQNKGYEVKLATDIRDVEIFNYIYNYTMQQHHAGEKYFFDLSYFEQLLNAPNGSCQLLLAIKDERIAAGLVLGMSPSIMQLHLSATHPDFIKDSPMKLLFDHASLIGRENNMHYMHMGSGVGGANDSLFHFKSGFSDLYFDYISWRHVFDPGSYQELVSAVTPSESPEGEDYFPLYRSATLDISKLSLKKHRLAIA